MDNTLIPALLFAILGAGYYLVMVDMGDPLMANVMLIGLHIIAFLVLLAGVGETDE